MTLFSPFHISGPHSSYYLGNARDLCGLLGATTETSRTLPTFEHLGCICGVDALVFQTLLRLYSTDNRFYGAAKARPVADLLHRSYVLWIGLDCGITCGWNRLDRDLRNIFLEKMDGGVFAFGYECHKT